MKRLFALAAVMTLIGGTAYSAEPILGNWKTEDGSTAAIASCGSGYCITLKSGKYAGQKIGNFTGKNGSYAGKITDPEAKKTYNGVMTLTGNSVTMKGCVMKVFCKSQTWTRL